MQRGIAVPTLGLILGGLILGAAPAGCVADTSDGGILVLKNIHPDTACVGTGIESEAALSFGRIDLLIPSSYLFFAQLKSRITALTGQEDQRTIITSGAKVDLTFSSTTLFTAAELAQLKTDGLTHFKALFSQVIKPNGGVSDAAFEMIPSALLEQIAVKTAAMPNFEVEVVATFTVEGDMAGSTVTSQAFTYPVRIGYHQAINVAGTCPLPKGFGEVRKGYSCNPFQDGVIDCCGVVGGALTCPATVAQ